MTFEKLLVALIGASLAFIGRPALAFPKRAVLPARAAHVPVGRVFHFMKSNRNGSHDTWY